MVPALSPETPALSAQSSPVLSAPAAPPTRSAGPAPVAALELRDLSISFPLARRQRRVILDPLSLTIQPGEFVVLLGETGCGKSTLLRMLLGQERPATGSVHLHGEPVSRVTARCAYVPQKYSLFPDRTVLGNLVLGPETSRAHILGRLRPSFRAFRREVRAEAMQQLEAMGLRPSDAAKYPHQLSGGMQQRVAIAQALMMRARVLLMDEAFSALDPATRASLQRLIRSVWQEHRPTVVFVTHNTAEALALGSRILVLRRPSHADGTGARVALDLQLPNTGMSLSRNRQEFLDLVDRIESASRGATDTSPSGDQA